jgi:hypothetical protein
MAPASGRGSGGISRRDLLFVLGAAPFVIKKNLRAQRRSARPKLAAICTPYFKYSHAQHIVSLPVTWRTPAIEMPLGAKIREAHRAPQQSQHART